MESINEIVMHLDHGRVNRTGNLFQYDYGQKLVFLGVTLPMAYEVHFSNDEHGQSKTMIGDQTGVDIPDEFLLSGADIHVWVYLHEGQDDGETVYHGIIGVIKRAKPTDQEPTPVQQSEIDQAIAALNAGVTEVEGIAEAMPGEIQEALAEAKASGEFDGFSPVVTITEITGGHEVTVTDADGDHEFDVLDGEKGDKGDTGAKGEDGADGYSPTVGVSSITGGHRITITDANGTQTVDVMDGDKGDTGNGIASVVLNDDYTLTINYTNGQSYTTTSIRGAKGDKGNTGATGATPAFSIGTVTTGAAGSSASASITGTAAAPVLNLTIPRGNPGNATIDDTAGAGDTTKVWSADKSSQLKSAFDDLEYAVDHKTIPVFDNWEQGSISFNNGQNESSTTACRTPDFFIPKKTVTVKISNPNNQTLGLRTYSSNGSYEGSSNISANSSFQAVYEKKYKCICASTGTPSSVTATFAFDNANSFEAVYADMEEMEPAVEIVDSIITNGINILAISNDNYCKLDTTTPAGVITINSEDGFKFETNGVPHWYGFIFSTEIGKTYDVSFNAVLSGGSITAYVMEDHAYPNKPTNHYDEYMVEELTADASGKYTGQFTASMSHYVLVISQAWDCASAVISEAFAGFSGGYYIKRGAIQPATSENIGGIIAGDGLIVDEDGVLKTGGISAKVVSPVIYAVNGAGDFEVFNDGIFETNILDKDYTVYSSWGNVVSIKERGYTERFLINTNANTQGVQRPNIYLISKTRNSLLMLSALTIKFADMPSISTPVKVLFIGDSLVASDELTGEFMNFMTDFELDEKIELLGRKYQSTNPTNRYEAVGGFAWPNYVSNPSTLPSPYNYNYFWNPTSNQLDIEYYFTTYCDSKAPDYIICNNGWNQRVNPNYYPSMSFDDIDTMVCTWLDAVHSAYPNCRIILNNIDYGNPDFPYPTKEYREWGIQLTELYNEIANRSAYSSFVRFCDVAPYFGGRTGAYMVDAPRNRYTSETERVVGVRPTTPNAEPDYVHPSTVGYKMIAFADAMCFLYDYANLT